MNLNTATATKTNSTSNNGNVIVQATFLSFFIIVGFVSNCLLIAIISQSKRLRSCEINRFLLSITAANLLNCLIVIPLMLGFVVKHDWDYGTFICKLHAGLWIIIATSVLYSLLLLILERTLAVLKSPADGTKSHRAWIFIAIVWIIPLPFAISLFLTNDVTVEGSKSRYVCHITKSKNHIFTSIMLAICYALPIIIILFLLLIIFKTGITRFILKYKNKETNKTTTNSSFTHFQANNDIDDERLEKDIGTAKFVSFIFFMWCLLEAPYIIMDFIQMYNGPSLSSHNQLIVTWIKLSYCMIVPLLTLGSRKEVWKKLKNRILCRKSNLVNNNNNTTEQGSPRNAAGSENGAFNSNTVSISNIYVPVLYATGEGLHVKRHNSNESDTIINVKENCDIYGSQEFNRNQDLDAISDSESHLNFKRHSFVRDSGVESANGTAEKNQNAEAVLSMIYQIKEHDDDSNNLGNNTINTTKQQQDDEVPTKRKRKKKKKKKRIQTDTFVMTEIQIPNGITMDLTIGDSTQTQSISSNSQTYLLPGSQKI